MNRSKPSMVSIFCALISGAAFAQTQPTDVAVTSKVRDFKEVNPGDPAGAHPHFNNQNGCSAQELGVFSVQADLDLSGPVDGGAFAGDNRTPRLMETLPPTLAKCYEPRERFSEWFADKPGINRAFLSEMRFQWDAAGSRYKFDDKTFFPLDAGNAFTPVIPGEVTFGNLQPDTGEGVDLSGHDYGFTLEFHTAFTYLEGQGQSVSIAGDDDIWLFLNGKRVADLGGVHQLQTASVGLDTLKDALGLVNGGTYAFDFYFAERHTASSSCTIITNLSIGTAVAMSMRPGALRQPGSRSGPVAIYDRSGRQVRSLIASGGTSDAREWDRLDDQGRVAAPGIYFWRTRGGGPGVSGSLVVP